MSFADGFSVPRFFFTRPEVSLRPVQDASKISDDLLHVDGLYSYALSLTHESAEAENLVQETYRRYRRVIKAAGRLSGNSNMKSWLFATLRNVWVNELHRRRKNSNAIEFETSELTAGALVETAKDLSQPYVADIETTAIREAIGQLPPQLVEVILLREFEDFSYQQIASITNMPIGAVLSRLGRARSILHALFSHGLTKEERLEVLS